MRKGQGPLTADLELESEEKHDKTVWWKGFSAGLAMALLMVILLFLIGRPSALTVSRSGGLTFAEADELVCKLDTLFRQLDEKYLEDLDHETLLDGAYHGMVQAVGDQYTRYYNEEEYDAYKESSSGEYVGIGVTVTQCESGAKIVSVDENGSAKEAGLQAEDILIKVNGTSLAGMKLTDIVSLIKGKEGESVEITYLRGESGIENTISLKRKSLEVATVKHEMLEKGIGYVAISGFDGVTTDQFRSALTDLKDQGLEGLIVDLRDNPGGRVDVVQAVTNELVPAGIITYTEDKNGQKKIYDSTEDPYLNLPLVVLVNGNSASASEIMAGAIQDMGVGLLVGTTTFGKGIVQVTMPLNDGTAMKVTMAKYYTPNGSYIHQVGIKPDIVIDLPEGVTFSKLQSHEEDIQLQTALEALKTKMGS